MEHELPALPYPLDAFEPHISKETMSFHHGKHHASYVKKLNKLIAGTKFSDKSLEDIVCESDGDLFDNAGQVWNHTFYWNSMSPDGGGEPKGAFAAALADRFGSIQGFREAFTGAGKTLFGSGWIWLCVNRDGAFEIEATHNADTPIRRGKHPLLTCDVWEHAYYIDYRNARADYLNVFWKIVNWRHAAQQWELVHVGARHRA
ncbi:MAG: superoxide dismutase [Chromatocurvus sp.]